jgi:uncharacterized protein
MEYQESTVTTTTSDATPRVFLQPIAAPSILGMFGLAGGVFLVASHMMNWSGATAHPMVLVPFVAVLGGLAQLLAAMWAFKARDGMATALHGTWGAFFIAFGALTRYMAIAGTATFSAAMFPELGYWFIVLAAITWGCTMAAAAENKAMVTVVTLLAAAATIAAIGLLSGIDGLLVAAGYVFLASAIAAWYTGTALMINDVHGREVWSLGRNTETRQMPRITMGMGEPGVIRGQ